VPTFNDPVLTISQIIKFVASSAAEAELAGLSSVPKKRSLNATPLWEWDGHSQNLSFKQTTPQHWALQTKPSLQKNEIHGHAPMVAPLSRVPGPAPLLLWGPGPTNHADYATKAHPDIYHESKRPTHAG
jgi:hypothetical protein